LFAQWGPIIYVFRHITRLLPPFSKSKVKIEENTQEDAVLTDPGQRRLNLETDSWKKPEAKNLVTLSL
jgi:hypothetical protein